MVNMPNNANFDHIAASYGVQSAEVVAHEQVAKNALRDIMLFHNALQGEMQRMRTEAQKGVPIDRKLFEKMLRVQNSYDYAMTGFKAFDDDMERNALSVLSEAIQDLMHYIKERSH